MTQESIAALLVRLGAIEAPLLGGHAPFEISDLYAGLYDRYTVPMAPDDRGRLLCEWERPSEDWPFKLPYTACWFEWTRRPTDAWPGVGKYGVSVSETATPGIVAYDLSIWGDGTFARGPFVVRYRFQMAYPGDLVGAAVYRVSNVMVRYISSSSDRGWEVPRDREQVQSMQAAVIPVEWCVALLACKNVATVSRAVSRSERRRKDLEAVPFLVYKTLRIGHRLASANSQPFPPGESGSIREHMVRGHFAHYLEGRPLFGKHVGRFWISPHLRGDRSSGVLAKKYQIADLP